MSEVEELISLAKYNISKSDIGDQCIAIKTTKDKTMVHMITLGTKDEEALLTKICCECEGICKIIVCVWREGDLDIPSLNFRKKLLDINKNNAEAVLVLQGEAGIAGKHLKTTLPDF